MSDRISVKGIRDGLLVVLRAQSGEAQEADLLAFIDERPGFFSGARLALDVGSVIWRVKDLSALREALSERSIHLWAVLGESQVTEKTAQLLGMATRLSHRAAARPMRKKLPDEQALWIDKTVRSGMRIESYANVIVLGDVNPGGEIISAGSIVIWGRLRGSVHAGAEGNLAACVCALGFAPQRLQIADVLMTAPVAVDGAHIARVQDGQVRVMFWKQR